MSKPLLLAAALLTSPLPASPAPQEIPQNTVERMVPGIAERIARFLPNIPGKPITIALFHPNTGTMQHMISQQQGPDGNLKAVIYTSFTGGPHDFFAVDSGRADGYFEYHGVFKNGGVEPIVSPVPPTGARQEEVQRRVLELLDRPDIQAAKREVLDVLEKGEKK